MSQSAGIDPWDYLDSVVRGEQLIVRLREDDGRLAIIEVELPDPVTPDDWDLLDVWIDEFMWTGRSAPISTTDTETTYRFEQQTDPLRQRRVWPIIACCAALCITTVVLFWANYPLLGSVTLLATAALAVYVKYTRIWPD
ncbi:MAG TPA: hypothetical protein VNB94_08605 [Mycobacteriales bacterium]|nr:hypothetical protein [Mycobacteriales bacterium]